VEIILSDNCGFCPGVRAAVQKALDALAHHREVYSLGHLIHNPQMVDHLVRRGLKVVGEVAEVPTGSVLLIRSHGVSPSVLEEARARGLEVIDATCGLVRRAQKLVRELSEQGFLVLVIGDPKHPEVRGLIGYGRQVTVIDQPEDIDAVPEAARLGVVAQTTISPQRVADMVGRLIEHGYEEIRLLNTLCHQSIDRQRAATALARKVDVMFVLGGLESANTRHLAELCRRAGVVTYHIEGADQFRADMLGQACRVGVTAGASTPDFVIEEFVDALKQIGGRDGGRIRTESL